MRPLAVLRILGLVVMLFAGCMLVPLVFALLLFREGLHLLGMI